MELNRARNPPADAPTPRPRQPHGLPDGDKTGVVLLVSGLFLVLVGVSFTAMGWQHYSTTMNFEWTQLLGPVLISVGGTFLLTGCKFDILSCWPCTRWDKEVLVMPAMEQTSTGHSLTFNGTNQPILFHNATAMLCIPPQYNFITQGGRTQAVAVQPGVHHAARRPRDAVCCVDNATFTAEEEDLSTHRTERDHRRSRVEKTEDGRCSPPPAYEDIYPAFTNTI